MTPLAQVREALEAAKERLNDYYETYPEDGNSYDESLTQQIQRALSLLPSLTEGARWRPMETAPRDGTALLLWIPSWYQSKGGMTVGLYLNNEWGALNGFDVEPSRWMPLPLPPTDTEQEKTR